MRFDDHRVAFVDDWVELTKDDRLWWQLFGCAANAMHIANNLGPDSGQIIGDALLYGDPPIEDLGGAFSIVDALPDAANEMALEVWASPDMPIIQSTISGRRAKKGEFALAAAGLPFLRFRSQIDGELLDLFLAHLSQQAENHGWEPGRREAAMLAQSGALGQLAAEDRIPDLFGFGRWLVEEATAAVSGSPDAPSEGHAVLLQASDRLDEQIKHALVDDYTVLMLLAASAAGYSTLCHLVDELVDISVDDEDEDDTQGLIQSMDDPATAERLVRAATWNILAAVIARDWPEHAWEFINLARVAITLDPPCEERMATLVGHWHGLRHAPSTEDIDEDDPDRPVARSAFLFRIGQDGYDWIHHEAMQTEPGLTSLIGPIQWSSACTKGYARFRQVFEELQQDNPGMVRPLEVDES